jgi:hypothetical protein
LFGVDSLVDTKQMKHIMLHVAGEATSNIFHSLVQDKNDTATFEQAVDALSEHFNPMRDIDFAIFKFGQLVQGQLESIDDYAVRLRRSAELCDFANIDREIKRQILVGCKSSKLKEEVLKRPTSNVQEVLTMARTSEAARVQAQAIEANGKAKRSVSESDQIAAVQARDWSSQSGRARVAFREVNSPSDRRECFRCGYDYRLLNYSSQISCDYVYLFKSNQLHKVPLFYWLNLSNQTYDALKA